MAASKGVAHCNALDSYMLNNTQLILIRTKMTETDMYNFGFDLAKHARLALIDYLEDQNLHTTERSNIFELWKASIDAYLSSYAFCGKLASTFSEVCLAMGRSLYQNYAFSKDRGELEEQVMVTGRKEFDAKFRDETFVRLLAEAVNSYSRFAKASGLGQMYQNISSAAAIWNNTFLEPSRDRVWRTPSHEIHSEDKFALFHYYSESQAIRDSGNNHGTPLLVIYAFINRHYILDLLPEVSIIRNLLNQGFDIYAADWGTPGGYDKELTVGHYVNNYLDSSIDHIRKHTNSEKVSILGYCWGGDLALMYAALHPEKVANVITLATPGDFSQDDGLLALWTRNINADAIIDAFGNAPSMMLNAAFGLRSPLDVLHKYQHFFEKPRDLEAIRQFFATEMWLYDSPPVIGEIYKQFVNDCYKNNLLIQNRMVLASDQRIDLTEVKMPYLNVIASNDDLVAPESSRALNAAVGSKDKSLIEFKSGHVGACISPEAHKNLWPQVGNWLKRK